jgi:hypothetical protein
MKFLVGPLDSGPGEFTLVIGVIRRSTQMRSKSFEGMACSIAGVLDADRLQ